MKPSSSSSSDMIDDDEFESLLQSLKTAFRRLSSAYAEEKQRRLGYEHLIRELNALTETKKSTPITGDSFTVETRKDKSSSSSLTEKPIRVMLTTQESASGNSDCEPSATRTTETRSKPSSSSSLNPNCSRATTIQELPEAKNQHPPPRATMVQERDSSSVVLSTRDTETRPSLKRQLKSGSNTRDDNARKSSEDPKRKAPMLSLESNQFTQKEKDLIWEFGCKQNGQRGQRVPWVSLLPELPGRDSKSVARCWQKMKRAAQSNQRGGGEDGEEEELDLVSELSASGDEDFF